MEQSERLHEQYWTHEDRFGRGSVKAPPGPWWNEPDKIQWIDAVTGYDCLAVRNPLGAWCGYVGVPPGHPDHGKDYYSVEAEVHGGLTFAAPCQEDSLEGHGICHIPLDGRPDDVWWLGFDCAHGGDLMPITLGIDSFMGVGDVYRDVSYVQQETSILAMQLWLHDRVA